MNTKELREWFRNIKKYQILIQNYNDTIAYYKDCLNSEDKIIELVRIQEERLAVQSSRKNIAPQEVEHNLKAIGVKKAKEELKKYIDKRNSIYRKMYLMDKALGYLEEINKEAGYIIECRLIYKMSWNDTEINFNAKFRKENIIGYDRMRHYMGEGLIDMIDYINSIPPNEINFMHQFAKKYLNVSISYDIK